MPGNSKFDSHSNIETFPSPRYNSKIEKGESGGGPAIEATDFNELTAVMARLRAPGGCPWDREQTHDSIKGHLIEEAFEVLDALESGDTDEFKEELGDLLLQVVFHARIAEENGDFSIADVVDGIVGKLKRRHPHVFGDVDLQTSAEVLTNWEKIKSEEKSGGSVLAGVPEALPALLLAQRLQEKAARVGFDWREKDDILKKLTEEAAELSAAKDEVKAAEEELGDVLFTLVNLARRLNLDAEAALRKAAKKFKRRFEAMEKAAAKEEIDFAAATLSEKDRLWEKVKSEEES